MSGAEETRIPNAAFILLGRFDLDATNEDQSFTSFLGRHSDGRLDVLTR
jgi:hypothetical protein